jgi:predicted transcriptional regulator
VSSGEHEIPDVVSRFIEEYIDTVPELETLLMMRQAEGRGWEVSEVAARNYIAEQRAHETLESLRRRGLVTFDAATRHYRYEPADELRRVVTEVAQNYQRNLSRIAMLIHSKPSSSIKEFARAFDFKKDR